MRAERLGRDLLRWQDLQADIAQDERQLAALLAQTDGQILMTLPGVATIRAAAFSAFTLPIERWATPEHLYFRDRAGAGLLSVLDGHPPRTHQPARSA